MKNTKIDGWLSTKAIGAGLSLSYYIFLATLYIQLYPSLELIELVKELGWFLAYFCIALIGENYLGFKPLMGELYNINKTNGLKADEKKVLMKSALERQVREWNRLWLKLNSNSKKNNPFTSITKGTITLPQLVWLTLVYFYITLIKTNLLEFQDPLNIILQVLSFLILIVLSGKRGISMLVKHIWTSLEDDDLNSIEKALHSIEHLIRSTAHQYYYYDLISEQDK